MQSIICLGPCCSGKTTWSLDFLQKNEDYVRFSLDEFKQMCMGSLKLDRLDKKLMTVMYNFMLQLSRCGKNIIIDNLPLDINWLKLIITAPDHTEIRLFDVTFTESLVRNKRRSDWGGHSVKPTEMKRYMDVYEEFINSDEFNELIHLKHVSVICDDYVNINLKLV